MRDDTGKPEYFILIDLKLVHGPMHPHTPQRHVYNTVFNLLLEVSPTRKGDAIITKL